MKNQSKTLVFFGNERILTGVDFSKAPIFSTLIKNNYNILAVFLENKETKSRKIKSNIIAEIAEKNNIPVYRSLETTEIVNKLKTLKADIGVLVSYGKILKSEVLNSLPYGIINIHPSSLPKYRGTTPIESAIANGDSEIGVSLMKLTEGMDSGPIYAQQNFQIKSNESKIEIAHKALEIGAHLLIKILPEVLSGKLSPTDQIDLNATYTQKLDKSDSFVNPESDTAININNKIRAMIGYPKAKIIIKGKITIITKSHVSNHEEKISFKCADRNYIVIDSLIAPNGKQMSAEDFSRGYN